jgi:DNA-binding Lrp family transcriptional regulator
LFANTNKTGIFFDAGANAAARRDSLGASVRSARTAAVPATLMGETVQPSWRMALRELDALDRQILYMLEQEARHTSSSEIAESLDASASTVRNRIQRLEEDEVIRGYHADVDYEATGYQLLALIDCTAPIPKREELAAEAAEIPGVVEVLEVMTGEVNVLVRAIGVDGDDLSRIGRELDDLGLRVLDEDIIRSTYRRPFSRFRESSEE